MTTSTKHEHRICDEMAQRLYTEDLEARCCICYGHVCPSSDYEWPVTS